MGSTLSLPVQLDLTSGIYLLSITGTGYKYITKVVIER